MTTLGTNFDHLQLQLFFGFFSVLSGVFCLLFFKKKTAPIAPIAMIAQIATISDRSAAASPPIAQGFWLFYSVTLSW